MTEGPIFKGKAIIDADNLLRNVHRPRSTRGPLRVCSLPSVSPQHSPPMSGVQESGRGQAAPIHLPQAQQLCTLDELAPCLLQGMKMPQVEASFQQERALERKRQLRVFHEPQHANMVLFVLRVRHKSAAYELSSAGDGTGFTGGAQTTKSSFWPQIRMHGPGPEK